MEELTVKRDSERIRKDKRVRKGTRQIQAQKIDRLGENVHKIADLKTNQDKR